MFPFDHPAATASYLAWYLVTLVLHVLPMNYVLAGSTYLAYLGVWEMLRGPSERQRPIADLLRDWMPFALGVTITAAIAPLLFLQILYRREFYTANLLLFHRWMAILPVLIVVFYLLYLQKTKRFGAWPAASRAAVSLGIVGCFAFVAWSWTENHLLSLRDQATWSAEYVARRMFYFDSELLPRLTVWYAGAFPAMAVAVGGQLLLTHGPNQPPGAARTLFWLALSGLIAAIGASLIYEGVLPEAVTEQIRKSNIVEFSVVISVGLALQLVGWVFVWRTDRFSRWAWWLVAVGVVTAACGATVLREVRRAASIDLARSAESHAAAARIGAQGTFLLFFVVNTLVIIGVIVLIRRGIRSADAAE